jgi:hypothetical protein
MPLETLSQAQRRLARAGFGDDLVAEDDSLRRVGTGERFDPAELRAVEIVRFEGDSNPDDEALIVAVANRDGTPLGTYTTPYGPAASAAEGVILRHLHRDVVSAEDAAAHDEHDHIAAVFADRHAAEAAIDDLREIGLGSEHLGVAIHHTDAVVFERDEEADLTHDVEADAETGALVGFLGGMLLFAVAVPGIGTLGAGGIAALGAASGFGSAMLGGYLGVAAANEEFEQHERLRETPLQPGEILVVACSHGHPDLVERSFQRHGGRLASTAG